VLSLGSKPTVPMSDKIAVVIAGYVLTP
jgi:hypothetical protein